MSKNVIFCYSGSGNCLDIAKNIAKRLGDTDIVMMRAEPEVKDVRGAKRVGFVFPCYAGGLPGPGAEIAPGIPLQQHALAAVQMDFPPALYLYPGHDVSPSCAKARLKGFQSFIISVQRFQKRF